MKKAAGLGSLSQAAHRWSQGASQRIAAIKTNSQWRLHNIEKHVTATPPRTRAEALDRMNASIKGDGVFIRAVKEPVSEATLLCPNLLPGFIEPLAVPKQSNRSASLWVSEADQSPYRYSPYLVMDDLAPWQVKRMADRDLVQEKSAIDFGPGHSPDLETGKKNLAQLIRAQGRDTEVNGPFFVHSKVNESIISYDHNAVIGVGVSDRLSPEDISNAKQYLSDSKDYDKLVEKDYKKEAGRAFAQALLLAARLERFTGREIPLVSRQGKGEFNEVSVPEDLQRLAEDQATAISCKSAQTTVAMKLAVRVFLLCTIGKYL